MQNLIVVSKQVMQNLIVVSKQAKCDVLFTYAQRTAIQYMVHQLN